MTNPREILARRQNAGAYAERRANRERRRREREACALRQGRFADRKQAEATIITPVPEVVVVPPSEPLRPPQPPPYPPPEMTPFDYPDPVADAPAEAVCPPLEELPPLSDTEPIAWAFADNRKGQAVVVPPEQAEAFRGRLFFVGDLHGDADALAAVAARTVEVDDEAVLVFLGDLFDRGERNLEVARLLVALARRHPGRILWLAGNHDIAFRYDEANAQFASGVDPAEFKDWLNEYPEFLEEGRALARIIATLPVLLVLGDHWVSHGGVPQSDEVERFDGFDGLTSPMAEDCVWSRMRDMREKLPNRSHRGAEVGYENARRFFAKVFDVTGLPLRHIVCAHQHEQRNGIAYLPFTRCFKAITCQCLFTYHDRDRGASPCYLAYRGDGMPLPHVLVGPESVSADE